MGKATGQSQNLRGKIGTMIYVKRKDGSTVVYEAPTKANVPQHTEAQMQMRLQFTNLAAVNTQFHRTLKKGFEGIGNSMSDYNAFIQCNANVVTVYVPKQVKLNGGCVLAPYQITRGKMPSIVFTKNGDNILATDIQLGGLVIGQTTTLAEFSAAVVAYNEEWQEGDQITFFYGVQTIDQVTHIPRAKISGQKVVLDLSDQTPLWDIVTGLGFSSVAASEGGMVLGMNMVITDGAAAWIHSHEDATGGLSVSTQFLYVDNSVLEAYQTDEAFHISADSYGGINTEAVFLQPKGNKVRSTVAIAGGSSNGGSQNGTTGGGTTEPVSVAAPTFSGETQFAESTQVTMSAEAGASIHYTLDGSTPTGASAAYSAPLTLTDTTTVKAIAVKDGVSSSVTSRTYTKTSSGEGNGGDE